MSDEKTYTFRLSESQAEALIEFGAVMERWVKRPSPLDDATAVMDEQLAEQRRQPADEPPKEGAVDE